MAASSCYDTPRLIIKLVEIRFGSSIDQIRLDKDGFIVALLARHVSLFFSVLIFSIVLDPVRLTIFLLTLFLNYVVISIDSQNLQLCNAMQRKRKKNKGSEVSDRRDPLSKKHFYPV